MIDFVSTLSVVASADGDGDIALFSLALLAGGPAFYGMVYARYRNKGKRHMHEQDTRAVIENIKGYDNKMKALKGLSDGRMMGATKTMVKGALINKSGVGKAGGAMVGVQKPGPNAQASS